MMRECVIVQSTNFIEVFTERRRRLVAAGSA